MMPWLSNPSSWLNVGSAGLSSVVNEYRPLPDELMLELAVVLDEDEVDEVVWCPPEVALCPPCGWLEVAAALSGPQPVSVVMSPAPATAMAMPPTWRPRLLTCSQRGTRRPVPWSLDVIPAFPSHALRHVGSAAASVTVQAAA